MPSPIPLDSTLGGLSIGVTAATLIFGINCMQTFLYFVEHSAHDGRFLKAYVAALWFFELITVVLINHGMYYYSITNWGDLDVLSKPTVWSVIVEIGLSTLIALMVQTFFAYRVYILSGGKKLLLPCIIMTLTLAQFAMGIVYTRMGLAFKRLSGGTSDFVRLHYHHDMAWNLTLFEPYVMSLFGLELAADGVIAASSIYYLRQHHERSSIKSTKHVIYVLIRYVVNTCLLEVSVVNSFDENIIHVDPEYRSLCLVPLIALWGAVPNTLEFAPFVLLVPRAYSLSLLCSLNNRDHLRDIGRGPNGVSLTSTSGRPRGNTTLAEDTANNVELMTTSTQIQFKVQKESFTDRDDKIMVV
ncbi:hypothetical protein MIND_00758100 [Mycena indigotica]|uniref:DUF6534 domain-containing protein n=1 Tax=Mycena indigotica TaxID=2126181 RepID=A0A8H6W3U7_9AGAR|nr:uncharacterized protein MIND_00758100 [Mycena indigotica]KAF7301921.1 hypothetical protein MIND_00758100 [Mycena indigotica]